MPQFEIETSLPVEQQQLASELLRMSGINYELAPMLTMTTPDEWHSKPIVEWPVDTPVFTSTILLFGVIPIDLHSFKLISVAKTEFDEASTTLHNSLWSHKRIISADGSGAKVKDVVYFKSRVPLLDWLGKPCISP